MRVFVAGHNGLVGSALVRQAPKDYEIVVASHSQLDLSDQEAVNDFLRENRPDSVILAAAKVGGIAANTVLQSDFLLTNLQIQNSVISAAASSGVSTFIFLGSSCIYPRNCKQPMKEAFLGTGKLEPSNEGYSLAKMAGIRLAQAISEEQGKKFFSLIPSNLYGPNDNFDLFTSHVPAALIRRFHEAKISKQSVVEVWGSGKVRREFLYVDDLAKACWFLLSRKIEHQLINIGTGEGITIKRFAELVANITGYQGEISFDKAKPEGMPRKVLEISRAKDYGWAPTTSLEDGLKQTYAWFQDAWENRELRGIQAYIDRSGAKES